MVIDAFYAPLFQPTYVILLFALSIFTYMRWQNYDNQRMLYGNNTNFPMLCIFMALLVFIIGMRPHSGIWFGDTSTYKHIYVSYQTGISYYDSASSEWFFSYMQSVCSQIMNFEWFLVLVAAGYFGFMFWASKRLFANNTWGAVLFLLSAFSTFSYATNGIRNGLACSIILFALSFATKGNLKNLILAGFIAFYAVAIHYSTALPVVCFIAAYFIRSTKVAILFWMISIILNIVAHGAIETFFTSLGFDDRLTSYVVNTGEYAKEYKAGFRLDFLLYGAMPIWLAYYVLIKRKIKDRTYSLLANTYIYANSFWVMMMQASYSNRFAYLSWFMLPVVLAYPCLRMDVWGNKQGARAATIMLLHTAFTFFMSFIYN
jgi:hypothetical protein